MYANYTASGIMDFELPDTIRVLPADWALEKPYRRIYFHQGRTDQNGGHHDRLNRMGLGFGAYHYHHDLSAHLHTDGNCPYGKEKISIINPFTGKMIDLGTPYYYDDDPYFSLNLVSKALTVRDDIGIQLGTDSTEGIFHACAAGDSIPTRLGKEFTFAYPKFLFSLSDNTLFATGNGELSLLCHTEKAELDDMSCYAYISLATVREHMLKNGYFTAFSDNGAGIWRFIVRRPSVHITFPDKNTPTFRIGDALTVKASISNADSAKLIIGPHTEIANTLSEEHEVTFHPYTIAEADAGSLALKVEVSTGGTALGKAAVTSSILAQVELPKRIETIDSMGLNLIANMERNTSTIEYDKTSGKIVSIPTILPDVGYGHDISQNPMDSVPDALSAVEALGLLKVDAGKAEEAIIRDTEAYFNQNQFNALVSLRYNIGFLGEVDGLLEYLEKDSYERELLKNIILSHYEGKIIEIPSNEQYRNGWYNRTEEFLNVFFDSNYEEMPIDAVNGYVILK